MLTSEQTMLRLRDAEISRLRKENDHLNEKLCNIRVSLANLIRGLAEGMIGQNKVTMLKMASELERNM